MPGSGFFLDYTGMVDNETINRLLMTLKKSEEFLRLDKTTGKRLYAVLVECLENIAKNSIKNAAFDLKFQPFITALIQNKKVIIKTVNPVR
jgi:hypothetical protein